jgi:hypothetical protein
MFLAPLSAACVIWAYSLKGALRKGVALALGAALLLPVFLGAAWAGLLAFPIALAGSLAIRQRRLPRAVGVLLVVLVVAIPFASLGLQLGRELYSKSPAVVPNLTSPQGFMEYEATSSAVNPARVARLAWTVRWWSASPVTDKLVGYGPGSASPSALGPEFDGPLLAIPMVRLMTLSASRILLELGLLGLVAVVLVIVYSGVVARRVVLSRHGSVYAPPFVMLGGMAFVVFYGLFYTDVWMQPGAAVVYWVLIGFAVSRKRQIESQ